VPPNASGRTLVVDLGGVVLRWDPVALVADTLAERLSGGSHGAPAQLTGALFGDFAPGGFWEEYDRGTIGTAEVAERMAASSGLDVAEVRPVLDGAPAHLELQPDVVALLHRVRAAGHRTVYLSNMPGPWVDGLEPVLEPLFSGGVFSCDVGRIKPEPQIFRLAEQLLELRPDRLLFLDDRAPNVEGALAVGWPAHLYRGPAELAAELDAAGWL
jgi:putative hydrolase of the HAD superfamily